MMDNFNKMQLRAIYANNDRQHNRMVQDKLKSLHRALLYSYQSVWVKKDGEEYYVRALINPDKVKFDYDEKIISIEYDKNFNCGDTFEWKGTNTHWIILKQELTERAYFRGNIRRCQPLYIVDPDTKEESTIWMAIRGPVETRINTIQKAGIVADVPNMSLNFYITNNEKNKALFDRYKRFKFDNKYWEVQAYDGISTPGILEVNATEDYECNGHELLMEIVDPNLEISPNEKQIIGETFVKPLETNIYSASTDLNSTWTITLPSENKDIKDVLEWEENDHEITVRWIAMISGSFILHYGDLEKTIIVESLF